MKKIKKRTISMLLVLLMVLTLLPTAALATDATVLNVSNMEDGRLSTDTTVNGFTIKATAEKEAIVAFD